MIFGLDYRMIGMKFYMLMMSHLLYSQEFGAILAESKPIKVHFASTLKLNP